VNVDVVEAVDRRPCRSGARVDDDGFGREGSIVDANFMWGFEDAVTFDEVDVLAAPTFS